MVEKKPTIIRDLMSKPPAPVAVPSQPAQRAPEEEGEPPLFEPYPALRFQNLIEVARLHGVGGEYEGQQLKEIPLEILHTIPLQWVQNYVVTRMCFCYRHWVRRTYTNALKIDFSKLDGEGALQYQTILDTARRVQHILDTGGDSKSLYRALYFTGTLEMTLPMVSSGKAFRPVLRAPVRFWGHCGSAVKKDCSVCKKSKTTNDKTNNDIT
jgi:hypothetical protein